MKAGRTREVCSITTGCHTPTFPCFVWFMELPTKAGSLAVLQGTKLYLVRRARVFHGIMGLADLEGTWPSVQADVQTSDIFLAGGRMMATLTDRPPAISCRTERLTSVKKLSMKETIARHHSCLADCRMFTCRYF